MRTCLSNYEHYKHCIIHAYLSIIKLMRNKKDLKCRAHKNLEDNIYKNISSCRPHKTKAQSKENIQWL